MHYAIVEDRKEDQDYLAGLIRAEHAKSGFPLSLLPPNWILRWRVTRSTRWIIC